MKNVYDIILQYSDRGMDKLKKLYPTNEYEKASKTIKNVKKGTVFLYTGFYVEGHAETDGPVGAYFLAKAFKKLGFYPVIFTDKYCKDFFKEIETIYIPIGLDNEKLYKKLLDDYKPALHLSCERCGKNKDGEYLNHRLDSITKYTADIDILFKMGSLNAPSIAIGDGGNEIGMGNFFEYFEKIDAKFHSTITCGHPLIASVSNWGAYALIATLSNKLLPNFNEIEEYLKYILKKGAIDGITKQSTLSVDAKEWTLEKKILEELKQLLN